MKHYKLHLLLLSSRETDKNVTKLSLLYVVRKYGISDF